MNGQTEMTENYLLFSKIYCHTCPDPTINAETTISEFSTIVFTKPIVFDQSQIYKQGLNLQVALIVQKNPVT